MTSVFDVRASASSDAALRSTSAADAGFSSKPMTSIPACRARSAIEPPINPTPAMPSGPPKLTDVASPVAARRRLRDRRERFRLCASVVLMRIIVRMQRGKSPGTGISVKFSSGTLVQPRRRAADAGKPARRSGVTVNNADATSSSSNLLRSRIAVSNFSVALSIASRSSLSACVAPRIPLTLMISRRHFGASSGEAHRAPCVRAASARGDAPAAASPGPPDRSSGVRAPTTG